MLYIGVDLGISAVFSASGMVGAGSERLVYTVYGGNPGIDGGV